MPDPGKLIVTSPQRLLRAGSIASRYNRTDREGETVPVQYIARIAVIAVAFFLFSYTTPMLRAETVILDAGKREALTVLPPLYGDHRLETGALDDKIVVVAFFASWCPPCNPEFDHLNAVRRAYPEDQVQILAVNIFESFGGLGNEQRLNRFLKRKNPQFVTLGNGESVSEAFGKVERIPTVFVFDRDGRTAFSFVHARGATKTHTTADELAQTIDALL